MSYSEKMVQALQAENLAEAQLMFEEALKKDDENTLADLGETLLSFRFSRRSQTNFPTVVGTISRCRWLKHSISRNRH